MTVDSTTGAVTTNEISSFKTFMQAQTPADNNTDNLLSDKSGGENIEALGLMYEVTGDQQILDLMVTFADHALNARNNPTTGLVNWDGNRELTWPIGANSDGTEATTTGAENGDVITHIVYCAQLILESPTALQNSNTASDPYGYGTTYRQRAATYVTQCELTYSSYLFTWFLNSSNQWYTPTDTRYPPTNAWAHNHPFPWNQQMMLNGGLERLATCHVLLNDHPELVTKYTGIIQTSMNAFFASLQNTTSGSDPTYVWSYYADPSSVLYAVEDNTAHSSYDLMGAFRAYESGLFGITTSQMTPFANTYKDVIYISSTQDYDLVNGTADSSHPIRSSLWSEWLFCTEFSSSAYTLLSNADLSSASSKSDYFARIMWMKNRRYQGFTLVSSSAAGTGNPGGTATDTIEVAPLGSMGGTVALSASGLPSGVTASFSPSSVNTTALTGVSGSSALTLTLGSGVTAGTYPITITGSNGTTSHTATYSLTVVNSTYTITASAGSNGSITPSGAVAVTQGGSQSFTITPATNYAVASVTVDGTSVGSVTSYAFTNVQANHTISATFSASGTATAVNDSASGITYTGTWTYSTARGLGDFQDDVHYTKTNGDSVSYTFNGTGIDLVTETNTDEGNVAIYIDGTLQQTISCVSSARQVQQLVYSTSGLASGSHTFKAVKSSGTYMIIDELVVHGAAAPTFTLTASAGSNGAISPSGTTTVNQAGSQTFTITPNSGYMIATLTIDGSTVTGTGSYTFSNVQANHTISATFAAAAVNDSSTSITYTGTWTDSTSRGLGDYQDDVHYTKTNGDSASYTFVGTGIDLVTETNTDEGNVAIYIDGTLVQTVSCTSTSRAVQQTVYTVTGLTRGSHTFKAVKSSGTYMLIDELLVHG